jgi:Tol biopolymer transport system component
MDSIFSITTATDSISIGVQRHATVSFTVTNRSGKPLTGQAVLVIEPTNESNSNWLKLPPPQKSERHFDVNGVENYSVEVSVPVKAPGGAYIFHLDMEDTDRPDETYTEGPTVRLQVAVAKGFPWWIIAVAAGVLAVIIAAFIFWPRDIKVPDVTGHSESEARATVTAAGLAFQPTGAIYNETPAGIVLTTIPGAGDPVRKATPVSYVLSLGREPTATFTPTPPLSGKIAFMSNRDGNEEIYVMNADGSNQTRLTDNDTIDFGPAWSPDGKKITFSSYRDGNDEIYVMNADGSNQINLTNNAAFDDSPVWSPNGSKIAFYSNRDGNAEIYVTNADGTKQVNLTNTNAFDWQQVWSPDGSRIAFLDDRDGNDEIYVMNVDGSNQINLTNNNAHNAMPVWSPDGSKIAFYSNRDGNDEIYVMNADGSNQIRLTSNTAGDFAPAWSPDGGKIAFVSQLGINAEIYVMNADGSNQINLTSNSEYSTSPVWSRDGNRILYESYREGSFEIYVMNADGSNQINLTKNNASDILPAWSP